MVLSVRDCAYRNAIVLLGTNRTSAMKIISTDSYYRANAMHFLKITAQNRVVATLKMNNTGSGNSVARLPKKPVAAT